MRFDCTCPSGAGTRRGLKHPGFLGCSTLWKEEWSHDNQRAAEGVFGPQVQRAQAVRLVRQLRREIDTDNGTIGRVARQLGYGEESVRSWVKQADIDEGKRAGTTTSDAELIKRLEQENKELKRANEILRRASVFFAAELDGPQK